MKKSLLNAINNVKTLDEMDDIIELINLNFGLADAKASLDVGSKVIVESRVGDQKGVITKINRTKGEAIVTMNGSSWNVPLTRIRAA